MVFFIPASHIKKKTDRICCTKELHGRDHAPFSVMMDTQNVKLLEVPFFEALDWNLGHREKAVFVHRIKLEYFYLVTMSKILS